MREYYDYENKELEIFFTETSIINSSTGMVVNNVDRYQKIYFRIDEEMSSLFDVKSFI